jgi:hypothetical protein
VFAEKLYSFAQTTATNETLTNARRALENSALLNRKMSESMVLERITVGIVS